MLFEDINYLDNSLISASIGHDMFQDETLKQLGFFWTLSLNEAYPIDINISYSIIDNVICPIEILIKDAKGQWADLTEDINLILSIKEYLNRSTWVMNKINSLN